MKQQCTATVRFPDGTYGWVTTWKARSAPGQTSVDFLRESAQRLLEFAQALEDGPVLQDLDTPEAQEGTQDAPGSTPEALEASAGRSGHPVYPVAG